MVGSNDRHTESTPYDLALIYSYTARGVIKLRVCETVGDLPSSVLAYLLYNCHLVKKKKTFFTFQNNFFFLMKVFFM